MKPKKIGNEDTHHSEHIVYNVDKHQSSEGENQDLPIPPSWKSTVPQWKDLNKEADWTEGESWSDIKAERLYNLQQLVKLLQISRLPRNALKEIFDDYVVQDSGATSSFIKPEHGAEPTGEKSTKNDKIPNGQSMRASKKPCSLTRISGTRQKM